MDIVARFFTSFAKKICTGWEKLAQAGCHSFCNSAMEKALIFKCLVGRQLELCFSFIENLPGGQAGRTPWWRSGSCLGRQESTTLHTLWIHQRERGSCDNMYMWSVQGSRFNVHPNSPPKIYPKYFEHCRSQVLQELKWVSHQFQIVKENLGHSGSLRLPRNGKNVRFLFVSRKECCWIIRVFREFCQRN